MIKEIISLYSTRTDFFVTLILQHLQISLTSTVIAAVLGLTLGILISEYKKISTIVLNIVNIIYTIPSIALLGILIPFTGIGNRTAIIALTIYALLPMVRNTYTGITTIDPKFIEAAKGMGSTNFQILVKIKLPMAVLIIIAGLRNMIVMTISLTGIASFIGAGGIGVAIYRGISTYTPEMTMAGSFLIALLALTSDFVVGLFEKAVKKKRRMIP